MVSWNSIFCFWIYHRRSVLNDFSHINECHTVYTIELNLRNFPRFRFEFLRFNAQLWKAGYISVSKCSWILTALTIKQHYLSRYFFFSLIVVHKLEEQLLILLNFFSFIFFNLITWSMSLSTHNTLEIIWFTRKKLVPPGLNKWLELQVFQQEALGGGVGGLHMQK